MTEIQLLLKEGLDDFKKLLAKKEISSTPKKYYWRLAFWKKAGDIEPQLNYFENDSQHLDSRYLSHNWHSFPAKFYPQLIRSLMNICNVKDNYVIYDPYAGCGTTLVECRLMGFECHGIDISKLAVLISKVKTNLTINLDKIESKKQQLIKDYYDFSNLNVDYTNFEKEWYNDFNLKQIKILQSLILREKNKEIKKLFLVALSSILKQVGNTKRGQIEIRFEKKDIKRDVLKIFLNKLNYMVGDIQLFQTKNHKKSKCTILNKNASKYHPRGESVDFIITSPPYGNGLDYSKIHKLSLALIFGEEEIGNLKSGQTGTLSIKSQSIYSTNYTKSGTKIIEDLKSISYSRARSMSKYYHDMRESINNMFIALKKKRHCVIIVGGTQINGFEIENDKVIAEIANYVGFKTKKILKWDYDKLRRSGLVHKIKGESIIILKKE